MDLIEKEFEISRTKNRRADILFNFKKSRFLTLYRAL
jgi:hypothetical protein